MEEEEHLNFLLVQVALGYIGGVSSFKHTNETTYSPNTTAGQNTGNGKATITFIAF